MNAQRLSVITFAWAVLFAVPSGAWALGATALRHTIAQDPETALGWGAQPWALALVTAAKLVAGAFAVIAAHRRSHVTAAFLLLLGVALLIYGAANVLQHALMVSSLVATPAALGPTAVRWHLLFWDPVWLLGGALFTLTGWQLRRESR